MSRLPDFLIIGGMKSGSTTLYEHLCRHPQIFMSVPKEPAFFSNDDNYQRGIDWYKSLFDSAGSDQIVGEASTCYSRCRTFPNAAPRIAHHIPEARLVYIIRDPVERAISHFKHRMAERMNAGEPIICLKEAIEEDEELLETGLYAQQIERYLKFFRRDQLHVIVLEEFQCCQERQLRELFEFLQVDTAIPQAAEPIKSNEAGLAYASSQVLHGIRRLRHLPLIRNGVNLMPKPWRRATLIAARDLVLSTSIRRLWLRRLESTISEATVEDRRTLYQYYLQPNRDLEVLLGKRLDAWRHSHVCAAAL